VIKHQHILSVEKHSLAKCDFSCKREAVVRFFILFIRVHIFKKVPGTENNIGDQCENQHTSEAPFRKVQTIELQNREKEPTLSGKHLLGLHDVRLSQPRPVGVTLLRRAAIILLLLLLFLLLLSKSTTTRLRFTVCDARHVWSPGHRHYGRTAGWAVTWSPPQPQIHKHTRSSAGHGPQTSSCSELI